MTTDGGGWTQLLQCLPGDTCIVGGKSLYNIDWLKSDLGSIAPDKSYLLGGSLAGLVDGGHFMVRVTDTMAQKSASAIYPLNMQTKGYFSSAMLYQSDYLPTLLLDSDGGAGQRPLRICWTPMVSPFARSLQGAAGLSFLGRTSVAPSDMANTACDFGPWDAQMLMRDPALSTLSTMWGMMPVANWGVQVYAHRVFVREAVAVPVTIVAVGKSRNWSDGTIARSCLDYLKPPPGARSYAGATGSGIYAIKPDTTLPQRDVYCDMTTDGGGWTQVEYLTTDAEGYKNAYAAVASDTVLGTLSAGSYKIAARALFANAADIRYSEPAMAITDSAVSAWPQDFKCGLTADARSKFATPGLQNQPAAAVECKNLANGMVSPRAKFLNYQGWAGCWTGPRLWIGLVASAPDYHGDYCADCVVTWKCDATIRGVYSTVADAGGNNQGSGAFWVR
ncbi:MAG: hypothetical protein EXR72_06485 [Myxococcales bacterium]|nr:hypothetical protein [Myxococcales bacterium]